MAVKKIIYWDIDGTLLHCGSDGRKALNETFSENYGIKDAFSGSNIGGAMDFMIIDNIMKSHNIAENELANIIDHYEKTLTDILTENKSKVILPGVLEIVEEIHGSISLKNALLTSNLKVGAMAKLRSLGLEQYFDLGGFGDTVGEKWDIAKESIAYAEKEFDSKFDRKHLFLIGDSTYDLISANKVGMTSIAVGTGWSTKEELMKHKPDFYFDDLSDVEKIVSILKYN